MDGALWNFLSVGIPIEKHPAMEIKINEPCHENWNAMTPNQQGAFCQSCMKDVVDFSKKTAEEIKDFFSKPQGKVCGRFEEKQLQELSFDAFFSRFTYWNFSKKFAVIFFMVFGFWIFSHSGAVAQNGKFLKGEVAYIPEKKTEQKQPEQIHVLGQPVINKAEPVVMGKIKCVTPQQEKTKVKEAPKVQSQKMVKGKIAVIDPAEEPKQAKPAIKYVAVSKAPKHVDEKQAVMGLIAYEPEEQAPIKTPLVCVREPKELLRVEPAKTEATQKNSHEKVVILYPNPNNGQFTVEALGKKTLVMLDANGKMVHTQNIEGSTEVNASHLPAGPYTLSLTGSGKTTHSKIIITR